MQQPEFDRLRDAIVAHGQLVPASVDTLEPELRSPTKYNFAPTIVGGMPEEDPDDYL